MGCGSVGFRLNATELPGARPGAAGGATRRAGVSTLPDGRRGASDRRPGDHLMRNEAGSEQDGACAGPTRWRTYARRGARPALGNRRRTPCLSVCRRRLSVCHRFHVFCRRRLAAAGEPHPRECGPGKSQDGSAVAARLRRRRRPRAASKGDPGPERQQEPLSRLGRNASTPALLESIRVRW